MTAARFTAIGAFNDVKLGYFDREQQDYLEIPVAEQVEVLSLPRRHRDKDGEPKVHAHAVIGGCDGSARGGHLLEARLAHARGDPRRITRAPAPEGRRRDGPSANRARVVPLMKVRGTCLRAAGAAWARVLALVFPQCSLGTPAAVD